MHALRPSSEFEVSPAGARPAPEAPLAVSGLVHRRSLLLGLFAGVLAAGAAGILLFDSWTERTALQAVVQAEAPTVWAPPEQVWPGARLSTGAAATWAGARSADPIASVLTQEPLVDVGPQLSAEWRLALAPAQLVPEATAGLDAAMPATPPTGQLPLLAASPAVDTAGAVTRTTAVGHPGISMRVYRTGPTLQEQLASCDAKGFFSRHACRAQLCEPHAGKVAECPAPRQEVLP